jgi:hypothetical protein
MESLNEMHEFLSESLKELEIETDSSKFSKIKNRLLRVSSNLRKFEKVLRSNKLFSTLDAIHAFESFNLYPTRKDF